MAKLTKQTVAAVSKGKKETVVAKPKTGPKTAPKVTAKPTTTKAPVKPKVTKAATKAVAKTPVKTPRKTTAKQDTKTPVKPVETEKLASTIPDKAVLMPRAKKVEDKVSKSRKPSKSRSFRTDTSKFRKYNNELRINLRNLIYDKGFTITKVAREMGILPHYLFNVLKLNKTSEGGNDAVVVLDIEYAVCSVIGANISSVLPEAEIVNPIYKSKNEYAEKVNKLQEENTRLNFLYTQTKNQADAQIEKLSKAEARMKKLEGILNSAFNKLNEIEDQIAADSEKDSGEEGSDLVKAKYIQ